MKYTIELTNKQKAQMDCIIDIVHRYVGFNPKLEPIEDVWVKELDQNRQQAYDNGYEVGYNEGLAKQSDPHFVPLQKCPVKLEDCRAYKLGFEDGKKRAIDENAKDYTGYINKGYNRGVNDLAHAMKVYFPLNGKERLDYFGLNIQVDTYATGNPKDLISKAKAYEKMKEDEIKVGDEVDVNGDLAIVTRINPNDYDVFYDDGITGTLSEKDCVKTGRHFEEISQLLDKLRGEEE